MPTPDEAQGGPVPLSPLDRFDGSLSQKVYQSLRAAILGLDYAPGALLRKGEICAALGVSRSPVSEAVARLAAEGLVTVQPQSGTFVARFSMDEIRESAFLREALEVAAVEYLAPRITGDQITQLNRNLRVQEALMEDCDWPGFYEMDAEMHRLLMSFTGFRRLASMAETVWVQVARARRLVLPQEGRVAETLAEHRAIVEALEDGDADAARAAIRHHLRQLITYVEPLESRRPDLFSPAPASNGPA